MSTVHTFPVPDLTLGDWATVAVGLGIGIGLSFQILAFAAGKENKDKVYTLTNFWLILSGVIHVSLRWSF